MPRTLPTNVSTVAHQDAYEARLAVEVCIDNVDALNAATLVAPSLWTQMDTESTLTPTAAGLDCSGGKASPAWGDPAVWGPPRTRAAGETLFVVPTPTANTTDLLIGWATSVGGAPVGLYLAADGYFYAELRDGVGYGCKIAYAGGTGMQVSIILRAGGGYFLVVDSNLRWVSDEDTSATVYPCISNYDAAYSLVRAWVARSPDWLAEANFYSSYSATPATNETADHNEDGLLEWTWTPGAAEVLDVAFRRLNDGNLWYVRSDQAASLVKLFERSTGATKAITGATQANPCVVTAVAHGFADGDVVYLDSVGGMTELNGNLYTVANKTDDTFELAGVDSSAYSEHTTGGTAAKVTDTERDSDTITLTESAAQRTVVIHDGTTLRVVATASDGTATTLTHTSATHEHETTWKVLSAVTGLAKLYAWPQGACAADLFPWQRIVQGEVGIDVSGEPYTPGPLSVTAITLDGLPAVTVRLANTDGVFSLADERVGLCGKSIKVTETHFLGTEQLDPVVLFSGQIAGLTCSLTSCEIRGVMRSSLAVGQVGRLLSRSCNYRFRDARCGYAGADTTCLKTLAACTAKSNQARYGGIPTMPEKGTRISYALVTPGNPGTYVGADSTPEVATPPVARRAPTGDTAASPPTLGRAPGVTLGSGASGFRRRLGGG